MKAWFLAARPKTLSAGIVPVVAASALALRAASMAWGVFFASLTGALLLQIGTNYVNDASDFLRGADTEDRLGPPRMAQLGLLTPRALYLGSAACFLFAFLAGLYLIHVAGSPILWIGLASIACAIAYTAGPLPLAYLGLGDLFVFIFFGVVAVCGTYYAHTLKISREVFLLSATIGLHGVSLIAINNIRDIPTDKKSNKRTLAVIIGVLPSKYYYAVVSLLPFAGSILLSLSLGSFFPLISLVSLPLAVNNIAGAFSASRPDQYIALLASTAKLQIIFGFLLSIGLVF